MNIQASFLRVLSTLLLSACCTSGCTEVGAGDDGVASSPTETGDSEATQGETGGDTGASDTSASDTSASDTSASDTSASDTSASDTNDDSSDTGFDPDCPQASDFLDLSTATGPEGYADPYLDVYCEGDEVVIESNGIPSFSYSQITPNVLQEQDWTYRIPKTPVPSTAPAAVPLGGSVAVAVNGLPIFGPTEAPMMGYRDPVYDNILDYCAGHTAPGGVYHFHARPDCLFTDADGNTSLVVAYSYDGYPILAPYECVDEDCTMTEEVLSSYQKIDGQWNGDEPLYDNTSEGSWDLWEYIPGSGDLDECNGKELSGGEYVYYATRSFPYFVGCYHGVKSGNMQG